MCAEEVGGCGELEGGWGKGVGVEGREGNCAGFGGLGASGLEGEEVGVKAETEGVTAGGTDGGRHCMKGVGRSVGDGSDMDGG
jgi:hypothetical protein